MSKEAIAACSLSESQPPKTDETCNNVQNRIKTNMRSYRKNITSSLPSLREFSLWCSYNNSFETRQLVSIAETCQDVKIGGIQAGFNSLLVQFLRLPLFFFYTQGVCHWVTNAIAQMTEVNEALHLTMQVESYSFIILKSVLCHPPGVLRKGR